jgi:hypothetical protein
MREEQVGQRDKKGSNEGEVRIFPSKRQVVLLKELEVG